MRDNDEPVTQALRDIGATLADDFFILQPHESVGVSYYKFGNYLIEYSHNISDGEMIRVSDLIDDAPQLREFRPIFELTVPGFNKFDLSQKLAWLDSIPKGPAFSKFLAAHVRRLRTQSAS